MAQGSAREERCGLNGYGEAEAFRGALRRVDTCGRKVREIMKKVATSTEVPTISSPSGLLGYFRSEYEPNASRIFNLSVFGRIDSPSLEDLGLGDIDLAGARNRTPIKDTIEIALSLLSSEEIEGLSEEEIEEAQFLVESPVYFDPDAWIENMQEIRPIITRKSRSQFPEHIRIRIKEINSSFVFGNFQSVASMSRSLLEFCVLDRSGPMGLNAYFSDESGNLRPKSLNTLIALVEQRYPDLRGSMVAVQRYGNNVMHPRKTKKVHTFPVTRRDAVDCMENLREVLARFYA